MKSSTVACSRQGCARTTTHPSGACHDHRGASTVASTGSLPVPVTSVTPAGNPAPGRGYRSASEYELVEEGDDEYPDGTRLVEYTYDGHGHSGTVDFFYTVHGTVEAEEWCFNGDASRLDGPAKIDYYPTGQVAREMYAVRGRTHRVDGPAIVKYDLDGAVTSREYYLDDDLIPGGLPAVAKSLDLWHRSALLDEDLPGIPDGVEVENLTDRELRDLYVACSFPDLLAEGAPPATITAAVRDGVTTAEGIRAVLDGAPVEWARSFEEGSS